MPVIGASVAAEYLAGGELTVFFEEDLLAIVGTIDGPQRLSVDCDMGQPYATRDRDETVPDDTLAMQVLTQLEHDSVDRVGRAIPIADRLGSRQYTRSRVELGANAV